MRIAGTLDLDGSTVKLDQGGNATTITSNSPAGDITLTLPATTDTLIGLATADILTNKTLTSPVLTTPQINDTSSDHQYIFAASELVADRTVTLPLLTGDDEFVFNDHPQTLTNKTLTSPTLTTPTITGVGTFSINDNGSNDLIIASSDGAFSADRTLSIDLTDANRTIDLTGNLVLAGNLTTTGAYNTTFAQGASVTLTLPTATSTLATLAEIETLTNKTLTSPVLTTPQINDTSADHQYVFAVSELAADRTVTLPLLTDADEFTFNAHTQTLTNKTLTTPVIASISNSGTITIPTGTDTLVARDTTDTLTNKTLTTPVIASISNSGTITIPTGTDTLVGKATTDTLTNKKFDGGTASASNRIVVPSDTKANLDADSREAGTIVYASDLLKGYFDDGSALQEIGAAAAGGKNYILNPDAGTNATDSVANTSAAGNWTVTRTTTAAELPEESKGNAFKITADASVAANDTVEWAIESTKIDDADGGIFGRAECKVIAIGDLSAGDYTIQVYNVTQSAYVGDSDTITGTGTYVLDVPLVAAEDYEFHLIAAQTDPDDIAISGIKIEPVSQTNGALIGDWEDVTGTITFSAGFGASNESTFRRIVGTDYEYKGRIVTSRTASACTMTLPFDIDEDKMNSNSSTSTERGVEGYGVLQQGANNWNSSASRAQFGHDTTVLGANIIYPRTNPVGSNQFGGTMTGTAIFGASDGFFFEFKVPAKELAQAHTPMASDVQYDNTYAEYSGLSTTATSAGVYTLLKFDTLVFESGGDYDSSTGVFTVPYTGKYHFESRVEVDTVLGSTEYAGLVFKSGNTGTTSTGIVSEAWEYGGDPRVRNSDIMYLTAGDTISVHCYTSGAETLQTQASKTRLSISRVSDFSARKVGLPFPNGTVTLSEGNGHGGSISGDTKIRNFTTSTVTGDAFTYTARTTTTGDLVTVNRDCIASITYNDTSPSSSDAMGLTLNVSNTSADMTDVADLEALTWIQKSSANLLGEVSVTHKFSKGDIIRAQTNGNNTSTDGRVKMRIQEIVVLGN